MTRFACIVAFAALTTFWMGNVGVYLLLLWVVGVAAYVLSEQS